MIDFKTDERKIDIKAVSTESSAYDSSQHYRLNHVHRNILTLLKRMFFLTDDDEKRKMGGKHSEIKEQAAESAGHSDSPTHTLRRSLDLRLGLFSKSSIHASPTAHGLQLLHPVCHPCRITLERTRHSFH